MKKIKPNVLVGYIVLILTAILGSYFGSLVINNVEKKQLNQNISPTPIIQDPKISKKKIEEAQSHPKQFPDYEFTTSLLASPISTPSFVTDEDKLTNYLSANSIFIRVRGGISKAYLYIQTGDIDIQHESVYFYIVDGTSIGGHLDPKNSLIAENGNEFLYDLSKLPLMQLPYSPTKKPTEYDVVKSMLNHYVLYNKGVYYIGGFVSTTKLPNQISKMEIRYSCDPTNPCQISTQ